MKNLFLILALLTGCAVEALPEDQPQCGSDDVEDVGLTQQAATVCVAPLSNQHLMSKSCPTCPMIRVYPVNMSLADIARFTRAAQVWNDAMQWNVVQVWPTSRSTDATVPIYGLRAFRNSGIDLAGTPCDGSVFTAGDWQGSNSIGCYRDRIRIIPPASCFDENLVKLTIAHELGHAIVRSNLDDEDTIGGHDIDHPRSIMSAPSAYSFALTDDHKNYLNTIRVMVLAGHKTLACAYRGVGC